MYCLSHGHDSTCAIFPWSRKVFYILKTFAYDAWKNFYRLLNSNFSAKTHIKLLLKNELAPPKTLQSSFKLKNHIKKNATILIFSVKAEMLLFSNFTSDRHQGGHPFGYFVFKYHYNFQKKIKISNWNRLSRVRPMSDLKRATSQLSLGKELIHWVA